MGFLCVAALVIAVGTWAQDKPKGQAKDQETPKIEELINKGEYQKAVDLAKKFIEAKEVTEGLYIDQGIAYQKLKDYPNAILAYEEAVKLNPLGTAALMNEASCYQEQKETAKLAETLKRVIDIDPTRSDARYAYAVALEDQGKIDDGLVQYEEVYKADPVFKNVGYDIGRIYYGKGEFDKAMPYLAKAAEIAPTDERVLLAQGQNFMNAKQYEKAIASLQAVLDSTKNEAYKFPLTSNIAALYVKLAEAAMEPVKNSKDKVAIAKAEAAAKEAYANALVYFDKLLVLRPNSEIALEGRGKALDMMGKTQEAIAAFKQYMAVSKNEAEKKAVAQRIKELEAGKK
jgi:tetratricopeptide (TPR) repeat protein